jgi:hypothetical protein
MDSSSEKRTAILDDNNEYCFEVRQGKYSIYPVFLDNELSFEF